MSSSYEFFTEVRLKDGWHCINPVMKKDATNDDGCPLALTYWSGSRSYFGETADKLYDMGICFDVSDLSPELSQFFDNGYVRQSLIALEDIKSAMPSSVKFDHYGYVDKRDIFLYESGELDDIYEYYSYDEYSGFTDEKKKSYQYYEWDASDGWFTHFKTLINNTETLLYFYTTVNYVDISPSNVRLVMFQG